MTQDEFCGVQNLVRLPLAFYQRSNVLTIAKELLGKIIVTDFDSTLTSARITEVEAYDGPLDKASHSYGSRRTKRTEVMYAAGGVAYVYLCYGLHQMVNIVTNVEGIPSAILIRSAQPLTGIEAMLQRRGKTVAEYDLARGPGNVAKALGLHTGHCGFTLSGNDLYLADDGLRHIENAIITTPRIGVAYAAEDALLPYRFIVKGSSFISGSKALNTMA